MQYTMKKKTFPTEEKDAMKYISKFTRKYLNEIKNSGKMITKDQFKQIVEKASEKVLKEFLNKQRKRDEKVKSENLWISISSESLDNVWILLNWFVLQHS